MSNSLLTDSLPLSDPRVLWLGAGDHAVKVCAGAVVDVVAVVLEGQEGLAVLAPVVLELLEGLKTIVLFNNLLITLKMWKRIHSD